METAIGLLSLALGSLLLYEFIRWASASGGRPTDEFKLCQVHRAQAWDRIADLAVDLQTARDERDELAAELKSIRQVQRQFWGLPQADKLPDDLPQPVPAP